MENISAVGILVVFDFIFCCFMGKLRFRGGEGFG